MFKIQGGQGPLPPLFDTHAQTCCT